MTPAVKVGGPAQSSLRRSFADLISAWVARPGLMQSGIGVQPECRSSSLQVKTRREGFFAGRRALRARLIAGFTAYRFMLCLLKAAARPIWIKAHLWLSGWAGENVSGPPRAYLASRSEVIAEADAG